MGTNYYLAAKPPCECCKRPYKSLHIGKSSGGWCFALHVIPEEGINTLDDWKARFNEPGAVIVDEYNQEISPEEMLATITERSWDNRGRPLTPGELRQNHAERGPNGLVRHVVDGVSCVGHGAGTWDYLACEFS